MATFFKYLIFSLATLVLAALSGLAYMLNPVTAIYLEVTAPIVRLLGRVPQSEGFSSMGSALGISLLWPLTLAPLHYLTFHLLRLNSWLWYVVSIIATGTLLSLAVLFIGAEVRD